MLQSVEAQALEPRKIGALLYLIREDLGYQLHQAVQSTKVQLSAGEQAAFHFDDGDVVIDATVKRRDFEAWISDELQMIETCVDRLLRRARVAAKDVDMVFLTGGSSFVPAVRFHIRIAFWIGADTLGSRVHLCRSRAGASGAKAARTGGSDPVTTISALLCTSSTRT